MRHASGYYRNSSFRSLWTWLWYRYHVPQNAFLVIIIIIIIIIPSRGQHLSCEDCLELRLLELFCVVWCTIIVHKHKQTHSHMSSSYRALHLLLCSHCEFRFRFVFLYILQVLTRSVCHTINFGVYVCFSLVCCELGC